MSSETLKSAGAAGMTVAYIAVEAEHFDRIALYEWQKHGLGDQ